MPIPLLLTAMTIALVTCSCSSFHREWRETTARAIPEDFTGPWEGRWVSTATGHAGKLRCLVTPHGEKSASHTFHYWARWGIFSGAFTTVYPVAAVGSGRWTFSGASDLGSLGGVYEHNGEATRHAFTADYRSSRGDRGRMEMYRPQETEPKRRQ